MKFFTIIIWLVLSLTLFGQNKSVEIPESLIELYERLNKLNGHVFFDTVYYDSEEYKLKKMLGDSSYQELQSVVKDLKLKRINTDFREIVERLDRKAISIKRFAETNDGTFVYDSSYAVKFEKAVEILDRKKNEHKLRSRSKMEGLLFSSSFWDLYSSDRLRAKKKLLQIHSIEASNEYILIVYNLMKYYGHVENGFAIELIVR